MSCTVNYNGRQFDINEIVDSYLDGTVDDMILPASDSDVVINGVPLKMQLDTANDIAYSLASQLILPNAVDEENNSVAKMTPEAFTKEMDAIRERFFAKVKKLLDATEEIDDPVVFENRKRLLAMQNEFSKIEGMALRILAAQKFIKFNSDSISEFLDFLEENDFRNYDEDFSFQRDLKDSTSVRMKVFLMGITNPERLTWDRRPRPIDMDDVFAEIKNVLTGKHPNYKEYRAALLAAAESKPWLQQVVDRLDKAEQNGEGHILNEFVSAFTSHPIKMLFINYSIDRQTGSYTAKITESNRHTITNIILDNWQADILYSPIYEKDDLGEHRVSKKGLEDVKAIIDKGMPTKENFGKLLSLLGINLSDTTLSKIEKEGFLYNNNSVSLSDMFTSKWALPAMVEQLVLMENKNQTYNQNNIFDSNNSLSLFRSLAREESKYIDDISLSSYLTGGKSIASHGWNRYAINKLRDLLENRNGARTDLKGCRFNNNAWLTWMDNPTLAKEFDIYYADVSNVRKEDGDKRERELRDLSYQEHLQLMFDTFFNQGTILPIKEMGENFRIIKSLYLTMSDKKNKYIVNAPMEIIDNMNLIDENNQLTNSVVDFIFENMFTPEYSRVRYEQEIADRDMKEYNKGRKMFFIFPDVETVEGLRDEDGNVIDINENQTVKEGIKNVIRNSIQNEFNIFLEDVLYGGEKNLKIKIDSNYQEKVLDAYAQPGISKPVLAMADFFVSTLVTNFRLMQNISGDPAMHFKTDIEGTWSNYAKRLAKDNASGQELDNSENSSMNVLALGDAVVASEYLTKLDSAYSSMDTSDAQALMGLDEYARLLYKRGEIEEFVYKELLDIHEKDKYVPEELLTKILRPFKPVITADKVENNAERKVYIKFSAYPLVKNYTKGTELEGLRQAMKKKNIHLAAFSSAIKLGNVNSPVSVFDKNRNFVQPTDEQLDMATLTISRDGYKIQQEVPEKDKNLVNRGTQFSKLIFNNIRNLGIEEINALEEKYDSLYTELYRYKANQLYKELMIKNEDGTYRLNFDEFNNIIRKELVDRQYDTKTLEYFKTELDQFNNLSYDYPFWAIPNNKRIQPVINSIIDSRIRKTKFPGKSLVLASSTGYKTKAKTLEEYRKENKGGIIPVRGYRFGENLAPQRMEGDVVHPAEIILPWNFRDESGNLLPMDKFIDKDGFIDMEKIPQELLTLQGFRIPTQGHNSMSHIKVVGFLAKGADNIVVAPAEYVTQMGSDFDVDKLYTYMKYYKVNGGKLEVLNEENSKNREKIIINKILDIHEKILSYPDKRIQDLISKPLDYGMFDDGLHREIYNLTSGSSSRMFVSPVYQTKGYTKAAVAKAAVGAFSLSSTFNSMIQKSNKNFEIKFVDIAHGKSNPFNDYSLYLTSGRDRTTGKINDPRTLRGKRTKSDVISAVQSAAVDNENKNILEKINITTDTMPMVSGMMHLGFEEDHIFYLLNQKIFLDDPSLVTEKFNIEDLVEDLAIKFIGNPNIFKSNNPEDQKIVLETKEKIIGMVKEAMTMDAEGWKNAIVNPTPYTDLAAMLKATAYYQMGKKIGEYQKLINLDSSGVKKNFYDTWVFEMKYRELFETDDPILDILVKKSDVPVKGYYEMYGKYYKPTHLSSVLYFTELKALSDFVYSDQRFSLLNTEVMKTVMEEIIRNYKGYPLDRKLSISDWLSISDSVGQIESELVKFLLSNSDLFNGSMITEQERLYHKDHGIAERLQAIKKTELGQTNAFLKSLEIKIIGGKPTVIFRAARKINDADDRLTQAVDDLYFNDRPISGFPFSTKELVVDLVRYNFIKDPFQKATNFGRFIGANILKDLGIHRQLKKFDMNDLETVGQPNKLSFSVFARQFIQNNPLYAPNMLVEKPNQEQYEVVIDPLTGRKVVPANRMIIQINNELYQSNGEYFQKIASLQNQYSLDTPILDIDSNFDTVHMNVNRAKSTRDGEGAQSRRLRTNISKSNISGLLDAIADSSIDSAYAEYASELRDKALHLFDDVVLSFDEKVPSARTVYTSQFNMSVFNPKAFDKLRSAEDKEKYILHELTHTLTKKAIHLYETDSDKLNAKQKAALRRLSKYRELVRNTISRDEMKAFEEKHRRYLAGDQSVKFTKREVEILYGSSNLEEFVSAVMTSKEMQRFLDSIPYSKDKSLLQKFFDLVQEVLESLGIDLTNSSLSKQAFSDVMDVISEENNVIMKTERHTVFDITPNNPLLKNCLS